MRKTDLKAVRRGLAAGVMGAGLLLSLTVQQAAADTPMAPPVKQEVASRNKSFVAVSIPKANTQVLDAKTRRKLWELPGWHRWLFVSNNGQCVVVGWDGMGLIPLDSPDDFIMFTFWKNGKAVGKVTLREIIPDRAILKRTASHYYWGESAGINDQNLLEITRADGKRITFDVNTGKLQE